MWNVDDGVTEKFTALALEPILVPPTESVYQLIVFPAEVAFKFEEPPGQIEAAVAVTGVGALTLVTNTVIFSLPEKHTPPSVASAQYVVVDVGATV